MPRRRTTDEIPHVFCARSRIRWREIIRIQAHVNVRKRVTLQDIICSQHVFQVMCASALLIKFAQSEQIRREQSMFFVRLKNLALSARVWVWRYSRIRQIRTIAKCLMSDTGPNKHIATHQRCLRGELALQSRNKTVNGSTDFNETPYAHAFRTARAFRPTGMYPKLSAGM